MQVDQMTAINETSNEQAVLVTLLGTIVETPAAHGKVRCRLTEAISAPAPGESDLISLVGKIASALRTQEARISDLHTTIYRLPDSVAQTLSTELQTLLSENS